MGREFSRGLDGIGRDGGTYRASLETEPLGVGVLNGAIVSASDKVVSLAGGGRPRIEEGNPRKEEIIDNFD
jgi:hypothetical protein